MDKTVIIIMIVCATVIALVAIICDYLYERKSTDASECLMSKKIIKVHRNYIAGFLGFAVIMLLTAQYGGPQNAIFTYLSFGSTITSLVLSILAIFVTVQSSTDIYKQFGTINKVSNQIDGTLKNLVDAESKLEKTSSVISSQMSCIVDEIEKRLDVRMQKTEDTISEKIQNQNIIIQNTQNDTMKNLDSDAFLNRIPYNGLLVLYAFSKGYETGKRFDLSLFFKGNERYQLGVIMTSIAAGYISGSVHSKGEHDLVRCDGSIFKSEDVFNKIKTNSTFYSTNADEDTIKIDEYFKE
jgi:hypothetical protein